MKNLYLFFLIVFLLSNCKQKESQKNDYPIQSVSSQDVELTGRDFSAAWSNRYHTRHGPQQMLLDFAIRSH